MRNLRSLHKMQLLIWSLTIVCLVLAGCLALVVAPSVHAVPAAPVPAALSFLSVDGQAEASSAPETPATILNSAPDAASGASAAPEEVAAQAVYLVNQERARYGLLPVKADPSLTAAALSHSQDMAFNDLFNHTGSDGSTVVTRFVANNYLNWTAGGENIAAGFATAEAVTTAWMNSAGHRANILNANVREIGVGFVYQPDDQPDVRLPDGSLGGPYFYYWTQDFGARYNVYPVVINLEAPAADNPQVTLTIHGQGWATQMRVSSRSDFAGVAWEPYATTKSWLLEAGNGVHTVYVQLRNAYDQQVTSSDTIRLTEIGRAHV